MAFGFRGRGRGTGTGRGRGRGRGTLHECSALPESVPGQG